MSKLNFVIAGFAKCGTTSAHNYLQQHPELFLTTPKEPRHFIQADFNESADEYWCLFEQSSAEQMRGEASVAYSESEFIELASRRLYDHNPDLKFIFLVRDPVKRVESQYRELHDSGFKLKLSCPFDLGEAMLKIPSLIADSHYHRLTQRYISLFGEDQIHVVFLEELVSQPRSVLRNMLTFLGVRDTHFVFDTNRQHNASQFKYRDTQFFRKLKSVRGAGIASQNQINLSFTERERLYRGLGWRKSLANEIIIWPDLAKKLALSGLRHDIENFLNTHKRRESVWPDFQSLYNQENEGAPNSV